MSNFFFLPFGKLSYFTHLDSREVGSRILANMDVDKNHGSILRFRSMFSSRKNRYSGFASGKEFSMTRNIRYRNSFLPMISGRVEPSGYGTEVTVELKLNTFVIVFGIIWGVGVLLGSVVAVTAFLSEGAGFVAFMPLLMLVFGYLLFTVPFNIEASIFRKDLEQWLEIEQTSR